MFCCGVVLIVRTVPTRQQGCLTGSPVFLLGQKEPEVGGGKTRKGNSWENILSLSVKLDASNLIRLLSLQWPQGPCAGKCALQASPPPTPSPTPGRSLPGLVSCPDLRGGHCPSSGTLESGLWSPETMMLHEVWIWAVTPGHSRVGGEQGGGLEKGNGQPGRGLGCPYQAS